jgi:hypothetical protein
LEESLHQSITATKSWQISLTGTTVSILAFSRLRNTALDILGYLNFSFFLVYV